MGGSIYFWNFFETVWYYLVKFRCIFLKDMFFLGISFRGMGIGVYEEISVG